MHVLLRYDLCVLLAKLPEGVEEDLFGGSVLPGGNARFVDRHFQGENVVRPLLIAQAVGAHFAGGFAAKELDNLEQVAFVAGAFAKPQRDPAEFFVEIRPETALFHALLEILPAARDDADVDAVRLSLGIEILTFCDDAQDFHLHLRGGVLDLFEEERSTVCGVKISGRMSVRSNAVRFAPRAGTGMLVLAGARTAVDFDKRPGFARGTGVHASGEQVNSSAFGSEQKHRNAGSRDLHDGIEQPRDFLHLPDHLCDVFCGHEGTISLPSLRHLIESILARSV